MDSVSRLLKILKNKKPQIRKLCEMESVVYDKKFAKDNPNEELYQIYRDIKKDGDLRWDITAVPPKMLGQEFTRTKGNKNDQGFQELYTVLDGEAIFLMQKTENGEVKDVYAVEAKIGDWIIVLPDYEIITINPSKEKTLITGNWVSGKTKNIYEEIEKFKGACFFYTSSGWIKNENYKNVPAQPRMEKALKEELKNLDFLRTRTK